LKALAAWRETEAQDKNIPRGRIVRDETLADIASHPPKSQEDLAKVRGLSQAWKDNDIGKRLMKVLRGATELPKDEMPDKPQRGAPLGKEGALVADLLKLLLKIRSREIDVASRLLTRSDELEALAAGVRNLPVLEGWRYEVFGKDALDLVEGKLAFAVEKGRLKMTHVDDRQDAGTRPDNEPKPGRQRKPLTETHEEPESGPELELEPESGPEEAPEAGAESRG
jgi:ribonuclease D